MSSSTPGTQSQLMMSAVVRVKNSRGEFRRGRALLDTCATAHFITEEFLEKLKLPMRPGTVPIGAIDGMLTVSKGSVELSCFSIHSDFNKALTFLVIPKIAERVPYEIFPRNAINLPHNIKLADPYFHLPRPIDLLIGSGVTLSLLSIGQKRVIVDDADLFLQKTQFGWAIAGGLSNRDGNETVRCQLTELKAQIARFWEIDDICINDPRSAEDVQCETHYQTHTTRDSTGRYILRLPFKTDKIDFGNSRAIALNRFYSLQRKLRVNPTLKKEYERVLDEYIQLGHMSLVSEEDPNGYYLPHQAVTKPTSTTTKVRVVFDASAETNTGMSLNNTLMVGPSIQPKLFAHLLRFRTFKYIITADIEKMYRQVLVHPSDRKYQYIFWYHENQIRVFELNTVTFGVSAASFLSIRTLKQLAEDEGEDFPIAAEIIKRDLYVDDLITGANSLSEIISIRDQSLELLKRGGFNIRQWASNHPHALDNLSDDLKDLNLTANESATLSTLGISWNTGSDNLIYTVNPTSTTITKRTITSEIAKIFDPLGLLGPVVIFAKIIMQECWKNKLAWDESLPSALHSSWLTLVNQIHLVNNLSFERHVLINDPTDIQLHGYCDASRVGYGACIYVRSRDANNKVIVRLLCAKSRLAPLKEITIPRLELCGALTLARLYREVIETLSFVPNKIVFWSDSTIVLQWIKKSPSLLRVFESNRVMEIQKISGNNEWRHVRTQYNPADALSRGQLPNEFLTNKTWFFGPPWLKECESMWPSGRELVVENLPGLNKSMCLVTQSGKNNELFERFSSYSRLVRFVARSLRFMRFNPYRGAINAQEFEDAEKRVVKLVQQCSLAEEVKQVNNLNLKKRVSFAVLSPFIDEQGLLRVGGRLKHANISFGRKYPLVLPSRNNVTDMMIRETHENLFHAGIQTTLYTLRQKFWILDGKNQVRKIVRGCVKCRRFRADPLKYKMGNLPAPRVEEAFPFCNCGVDFFGPLLAKEKKFRNRATIKVYGCVFICMSSKAVHIEIVSDLSTESFLAAFKRFIGRRGLPANVYSDNGTNFVGANNQLRDLYALIISNEFIRQTSAFATQKGISWHFNPPLSPHFGGIWEAAVKSFKHHFKRVVGERLFTFEELTTLATEIEAILNSRPICPISTDPNDPLALTPAHLLIGRPFSVIPETDYLMISDNRLTSWALITKARQDFWKRWNIEYLNELQKRQKWLQGGAPIRRDSIVVLIDKNLPCMRWLLGRVIHDYPGDDGVVRVVDVRTTKGVLKRNVTTLCPLLDY